LIRRSPRRPLASALAGVGVPRDVRVARFRPWPRTVGYARCRHSGSCDPQELRSPSSGPFHFRQVRLGRRSVRPGRSHHATARCIGARAQFPAFEIPCSCRGAVARDAAGRSGSAGWGAFPGTRRPGRNEPPPSAEPRPPSDATRVSTKSAESKRVPAPRPGTTAVAAVPRADRPTAALETGRERCGRRWSRSCGGRLGFHRRGRTASPPRTRSAARARDRRGGAECEPEVAAAWHGTVSPPASRRGRRPDHDRQDPRRVRLPLVPSGHPFGHGAVPTASRRTPPAGHSLTCGVLHRSAAPPEGRGPAARVRGCRTVPRSSARPRPFGRVGAGSPRLAPAPLATTPRPGRG